MVWNIRAIKNRQIPNHVIVSIFVVDEKPNAVQVRSRCRNVLDDLLHFAGKTMRAVNYDIAQWIRSDQAFQLFICASDVFGPQLSIAETASVKGDGARATVSTSTPFRISDNWSREPCRRRPR